ncbi:hypothetical protein SDC9_195749 [bioreactor metagenome]|uniref:Uncharacterized protein n=1 Tax=bioreactor metagenome TaxID=1076179 RepID=A0A645IIK2_9ZZZZ
MLLLTVFRLQPPAVPADEEPLSRKLFPVDADPLSVIIVHPEVDFPENGPRNELEAEGRSRLL